LFAKDATHTWVPEGVTDEGIEHVQDGMRMVLTGFQISSQRSTIASFEEKHHPYPT
jgi:hypothetical protein